MSGCPFASRRGFLGGAGGLAGGLAALAASGAARASAAVPDGVEPFWGPHQGGIATAAQRHTYFAAFDLIAKDRAAMAGLLRRWTEAASRLAAGEPVAGDGGSATGLAPARLTVTFGFGPGLFAERYGLAALRPAALADLPRFGGDQLDPARSGGDLSVQACADDPQVAFHAVRELIRLGYGQVQPRWAQAGFLPDTPPDQTPRNLMGFKDGTNNARPGAAATADLPRRFEEVVWVGDDGPAWMRGGSYLVARRIRISLEHWDRVDAGFQDEVVGRHKSSGAPIGKVTEFELLGLDRADADGNPAIAETAHARLGAAAVNGGAQIHRRAYSYNDGLAMLAERWPPWRQGMMLDAGLFFLAYQRDPREGFSRIFAPMAKLDALNQFTTHVGSALFACPPGARPGEFIGQGLFA